ncbi:MAG: beta-galactosidase [Defluviitaleaceae bacterium]|nr:beta-galactosidase [Defluviitaleaceae bacterium]
MNEIFNGAFIFGAQYYRAPTPLPHQWESDLKRMAEHGFNCIKIWIAWRWNNPAENEYYFDDIDRLMDLAAENNLRVVMNIIYDAAPAWFYIKYPDSLMVTADGRTVYPRTVSHRQSGGAPGPCYNHGAGINEKIKFTKKTAERYKNHPALFIWDLWNEPELTCAVLRTVNAADMVCYCPNCHEKFITWLVIKYETINVLNKKWNRNYGSFGEVELPRDGSTFNDMVDWRLFFANAITSELHLRKEAIRQTDAKTPVMIHTVPMPLFNMLNASADDYSLASLCDLFGNSTGSSPFPAALSASAACGKPFINAEIHALWGDTYTRNKPPSFNELLGHISIPLARGAKGFLFWQYRPETLGRESPAWGLTDLAGNETPWLADSSKIAKALAGRSNLLNAVKLPPAEIAIINSLPGQIFDWCASGNVDRHSNSVIGAYNAFYRLNENADIINTDMIGKYKIIYYPHPYYVDESTAQKIKSFVENGGLFISEANFAQVEAERGLHAYECPGFNFSNVFGCKAGLTVSSYANETDMYTADEKFSEMIPGYHFKQTLRLNEKSEAKVLAFFSDGEPAIVANSYGKGTAVFIGSLPSYAYQKNNSINFCKFLKKIMMDHGHENKISVRDKNNGDCSGVRADLLSDGLKHLLIINSVSEVNEKIIVHVREPNSSDYTFTDLFTGAETHSKNFGDYWQLCISVPPQSHMILAAE